MVETTALDTRAFYHKDQPLREKRGFFFFQCQNFCKYRVQAQRTQGRVWIISDNSGEDSRRRERWREVTDGVMLGLLKGVSTSPSPTPSVGAWCSGLQEDKKSRDACASRKGR